VAAALLVATAVYLLVQCSTHGEECVLAISNEGDAASSIEGVSVERGVAGRTYLFFLFLTILAVSVVLLEGCEEEV